MQQQHHPSTLSIQHFDTPLLQSSQSQGLQSFDLSDPDSERTVRMDNLRYDIKPSQVEAFFREYNPEPDSVKFMMNNGMPNGKYVVVFSIRTHPFECLWLYRLYNASYGVCRFRLILIFHLRGTIKLKSGADALKAVECLHTKELAGRPLILTVLNK